MPTYSTGYVENPSVSGVRRFNSIVMLLTNSATTSGTAFLESFYVATVSGANQPFAAEGFDMTSQTHAVRNFSVSTMDYFVVQTTVSLPEIAMKVFGVSSSGQYVSLPVGEIPSRRITGQYRDNISIDGSDFAAISFRRRSAFTRPRQYAATLLPQSVEILATRPVRYKLILGGTVNGTYTLFPTPNTELNESSSAMEVNYTCTTVTGGQIVYQGQGTGLSGAYQNTKDNLLANNLLVALPPSTPITLTISCQAGTDKAAVTFNMEEQW